MPHDPLNPDDAWRRNLPYLSIPYWAPKAHGPGDPGDQGDVRPLPADIVPYLCESIATAAPYIPGQPLTVRVAVRNWGGGSVSSHAMVQVWWDFPATSFARMEPSRLVGVDSVSIGPRGETRWSAPMTCTFSTVPPPHICLVACVDHGNDRAPRTASPPFSLTPLPGVERHWSQHNLSYTAPSGKGIVHFPFFVDNPYQDTFEMVVEARPLDNARIVQLLAAAHIKLIRLEARFDIASLIDLRVVRGMRQARHPYGLKLAPGERSEMHLRIALNDLPRAGEGAAFEVVQRRAGADAPSGGIAVVVLAPDARQA